MTEAKSSRRRRRSTTAADQVPQALANWFAGIPHPSGKAVPFLALIHPHRLFLGEFWEAWKGGNPGVAPPAGYEWLDEPASEKHLHPAWLVKLARQSLKQWKIKI